MTWCLASSAQYQDEDDDKDDNNDACQITVMPVQMYEVCKASLAGN